MNAGDGCPAEALRAKAGCPKSSNELRLGKPNLPSADRLRNLRSFGPRPRHFLQRSFDRSMEILSGGK